MGPVAVLTVILEELFEHIVERRALRQLRQRVRVLFFDGLRRGNVHDRLGDAVDEIGQRRGLGLRKSRSGRRQEKRRRAAGGKRGPPSGRRSGKRQAGENGGGRLANAHGVFLLRPIFVKL